MVKKICYICKKKREIKEGDVCNKCYKENYFSEEERNIKNYRYLYEVIESKSPEMPVGKKFFTDSKLHDGRTGKADLSDVKCREYLLKLIKVFSYVEFQKHKMKMRYNEKNKQKNKG